MKKLVLIALVIFTGCTDSDMANITSLGSSAHVICYSGTAVIYNGFSTGKVATVTNSDGWQFKDSKSGKFIRVSGACVVEN